jgi:acetyl esterase/lipase
MINQYGSRDEQRDRGEKMEDALREAGVDADELTNDELETLKHRLAGPSITKSGQEDVDQRKVRASVDGGWTEAHTSIGFRNHLQCLQR